MPTPTEAATRKALIDPALQKAGWDLGDPSKVGIEIPVDGFDPAVWKTLHATLKEHGVAYDVKLPAGISDYTLHRPNGDIIAIVEAKRTIVDPRLAEAQAEFYVTQRPFNNSTPGRSCSFSWTIFSA